MPEESQKPQLSPNMRKIIELEKAELSKKEEQSLSDLLPSATIKLEKVELSPLSPAIMRIKDNIDIALHNQDETVLTSEEDGLLLIYLMLHATTQEKREQLWFDARKPLELMKKFITWNFEQDFSQMASLMAQLNSEIDEYNKASEVLSSAEDDSDEGSLKKK